MAAAGEVFDGGGPVGEALASVGWAETPLGDPSAWPQSLVTTVGTLLRSRFSMWMGWGPDLTFFCNDAYRRDTLGAKYPWALGRPASEVWAEIWEDLEPRVATVLDGAATWDEALLLFLERSGFPEETYHTFSYSPLRDDSGAVAGLFCVVTEDTERVISSRRLGTLRQLGSDPTAVRSGREALEAAGRHLATNPFDMPFAALYRYDESAGTALLEASTGVAPGHPVAPREVPLGGPTPWGPPVPLGSQPVLVERLAAGSPTGAWQEPPTSALMVPVPQPGQARPAGMLVAALNRYRPLDEGYRSFVELVAGQVGASLSSALAYEAERERAEQLAELDRAKTAFFTNVSHELRTPLTLLLGPADDALRDTSAPLPAAQRQRVEVVARNALRLLKLVNTLLDFSRLESGRLQSRPEPVDLGRLTAELASGFASSFDRAGLALQVDCRPLDRAVWVDPEMWAKVVFNLLSNALKFTFEGRVTVRVGPGPDGGAAVEVSDTGIGIEPAEQGRLFERFYRATASRARTHEGSGIGLALVAELVGVHGGSVDVDSTPGVGTTFVVTLPFGGPAGGPASEDDDGFSTGLAADDRRPGEEALPGYLAEVDRWAVDEVAGWDRATVGATSQDGAAEDGARAGRVLVIDDNADMRGYVGRLLAGTYEVLTAADGPSGLEAAASEAPDLILTDVMMPGLDGFGVLERLRSDPATSGIPVVLLSARAGEEATLEGLEAGADDYLVKPFSARELLARVRSNLELERVRRGRDRLAANQELLDQAQRLAGVASWEVDLDDGALTGSAELLRQLQVTAEELRTQGLAGILSSRLDADDAALVERSLAHTAATGEAMDAEVRITTPDGVERTYRSLGTLERDAAGRPRRVRGSNQDVTDQRLAEQAMAAAAAAREAASREHRIADELQRSLLPMPRFTPDGLAIATFYCAGVEGTQVGGDWYDVVELGAGRAALVIGDVMGRGVRAAAVMGQLRAAVRAYARLDLPPQDVLELLDATVGELGEDQIVTCVYGIYDPADRSFCYSNAGHLPPLLRRNGEPAQRLEGAGPPLGTGAGAPSAHEVVLPPGAVLALYTDGLVERRGSDLDAGIDALAAALDDVEVVEAAGDAPARLVGRLLPEGPDDDVAVLLAGVEDRPAGTAASVEVYDDPAGVERSRRFVTSALDEWRIPEVADAAVLVTSELVTNAIVHGKAPVGLRMRATPTSVIIEVSDAAQVLPRPMRADPDDEHGRGLQIVAALAERWGTRTVAGGKVVWCRLALPHRAHPAGGVRDD